MTSRVPCLRINRLYLGVVSLGGVDPAGRVGTLFLCPHACLVLAAVMPESHIPTAPSGEDRGPLLDGVSIVTHFVAVVVVALR
jgi:hypothetical protein